MKSKNSIPCGPHCPERCADPNCHATCQKYINWCKNKKNNKQQIEEYKTQYSLSNSRYTARHIKSKYKTQSPKKWR